MTDETKDLAIYSSDKPISPFSSPAAFRAAQEMAQALMTSDFVPEQYRGNLGNCVIALDVYARSGASLMAIIQNLNIIYGKPSFSASYCVTAVNQSGRFAQELQHKFFGEEHTDSWGCYAWTINKRTKETIKGPSVTVAMAKAEGWWGRNKSKWPTMTELMLYHRASAFFTRTICPDLLMGMQTTEELKDINPEPAQEKVTKLVDTVQPISDAEIAEENPDQQQPEPATVHKVPDDKTVGETVVEMLPEKATLKNQPTEWPKYNEDLGSWIDSNGVIYDTDAHAGYRAGEGPTVNADGSFKARRGASMKAKMLAEQAKEKAAAAEAKKNEPVTVTQDSEPAVETKPFSGIEGQVTKPAEEGGQETPYKLSNYELWKKDLSETKQMQDLFDLESRLDDFTDEAIKEEGNRLLGERYNAMVQNGEFVNQE